MRPTLRLLAALLVLAVMHQSVSASPLMPEPVKEATGQGHHAHDGMKGKSQSAPDPGTKDCCKSGTCDCGCTQSHAPASVFRPAPTAHDWARIADVRADDSTDELPGYAETPFRPPA